MTEVNEFNRRNIEEFRSNHGRLGGPSEGAPVLLLHTTGARSGQELTDAAPLIRFVRPTGPGMARARTDR